MKELFGIIAYAILALFAIDVINYIYKRIFLRRKLKKNQSNSWKDAARAFGIKAQDLRRMSKEEVKKIYRKMAKVHHPDTGGCDEEFRNLHNAYEFVYARAN